MALLFGALVLSAGHESYAAIIFTRPANPIPVFGAGPVPVPPDLNDDGSDDYTFRNDASAAEFILIPASLNRVVVTLANATVQPLALGASIDLSL
jgi:hypothetical protein